MSALSPLYADLSGYYDRFCLDVDYTAQCDFAARVARTFGDSDGHAYLDLACGTGRHLALMTAKGYAGTGLDNSQAMLDQAARRCPGLEWLCCDLAAFDTPGRFDLITCFLYSIHYSHPRARLGETLRRAFAALRPGGVLLFDLVDMAGIGERDAVTRLDEGDARFTFRSGWRYAGAGETLSLEVSIEREDDLGRRQWSDRHAMTAIGIDEVRTTMRALGFAVTVLERDFSGLREWDGASFNVMMVGTRPR
jgi:SAM-dependent methyltransferase